MYPALPITYEENTHNITERDMSKIEFFIILVIVIIYFSIF